MLWLPSEYQPALYNKPRYLVYLGSLFTSCSKSVQRHMEAKPKIPGLPGLPLALASIQQGQRPHRGQFDRENNWM